MDTQRRNLVLATVADVSTAELDYLLAALPAPDGRELVVMCPDGTSQTLSMSGPADTVTAAKALLVALMGCALGQMQLFQQGEEDELEDDRLVITLTSTNLFLLLSSGRTFTYQSDMDTEGLFYWIGTRGKTRDWQNPVTADIEDHGVGGGCTVYQPQPLPCSAHCAPVPLCPCPCTPAQHH
jgi:hypothetical protein